MKTFESDDLEEAAREIVCENGGTEFKWYVVIPEKRRGLFGSRREPFEPHVQIDFMMPDGTLGTAIMELE